MPYATQDDLVPSVIPGKTCVELTDDTRSGQIDTDVVASKLAEASGTIEMYCRERYTLPLQLTAELKALTVKIAVYLLYGRRSGTIPESVKDNYTEAMRMLRDIAAGKASLDQPIGDADQGSSGGPARSRKPQVFSERNMRGFN